MNSINDIRVINVYRDGAFRRKKCRQNDRVLGRFINELEKILKYPSPYVEGNSSFWNVNIQIQHPLAEIEIVPWDSSLVLVLSKNDSIISKFKENYPQAIELVKFNSDN